MPKLTHYPAAPELSDRIAFYGTHETEAGSDITFVSPPLGFCGFIFTLEGGGSSTVNGVNFLCHDHCATGQVTSPVEGISRGKFTSLLVFIQPLGLYRMFGCDMPRLTDSSMPLGKLLGEEAYQDLLQPILAADGNEAQIEILNNFFLARPARFDVPASVLKALEHIHTHQGNITIQDLEAVCFTTRRSLERHFQTCIGLSPKVYANIYRFKCFMNYLRENPKKIWAELCEENGFYDHSHLTRYFTEYLRIKPHELVRIDKDFINFLLQQ